MRTPSRRTSLVIALASGVAALTVGFLFGVLWGFVGGLVVLIVATLTAARSLEGPDANPARRRFLEMTALGGVAALAAGDVVAWATRWRTVSTQAALRDMAENVGAEGLELVLRDYRPGRSGDLQLILTPGSTSNYANESKHLMHRDPRSSHALPWMYLERLPIVLWSGDALAPADRVDRVTLADLAPTIASLIGFDGFEATDGRVLPGTPTLPARPKVVVTFVIDGGGWNVLEQWPDAWPNLKRLMREGIVYRNAITGSSPAVTACAHATIGTGAYPRTHGITGHNIRDGTTVRKAYREPGRADPSDILVPTLADRWVDANAGDVWVGEIGYQVWHLGMLGRGGRPLGDKPVAVYWDDDVTSDWQPQNPAIYRLPRDVPDRSRLDAAQRAYVDPGIDDRFGRFLTDLTGVCCTPPIIQYEGDLIETTIRSEALGSRDATDLLFVNYKSPDYTGHVYNMLSERERIVLAATDAQLGRLSEQLLGTFGAGNFVLVATADHGQCPTVDATGGVRVDPVQLEQDIERRFGGRGADIVQAVVPSEIYLHEAAMRRLGVTRDDVAAFLRDYTYRDNIGAYVKPYAVEPDRLDEHPFAAVLPTDFLDRLRSTRLTEFGDGRLWGDGDHIGVPPVSW